MKPFTQEELEKFNKIIQHLQLGVDIELRNIIRLVKADLSHIGDGMVRGDTILFYDRHREFLVFNGGPACYSLDPETIKIGYIEVPTPVSEPLEFGQNYYAPNTSAPSLFTSHTWHGSNVDRRDLRRRRIHLTREAAITHAEAEIIASGGDI